MDMTDQYNTQLTPEEQQSFEAWARAGGKDPQREKNDYDLQGYFKATNGAPLGEGHLTDQFKKPNHPTFSTESQYHGNGNQGGAWGQNPDGTYNFTPGATNMQVWGAPALQQYFDTYEKGNKLQFPSEGQ